MRVLTAVQLHETAERYEQCIEKDEYFVHGRNISKAEIIKNAITPILGENTAEADKYLQLANQPEIKQIFKTNTDEAIARGAFGTPTFIVKTGPNAKEMLFFGSDRFETISAILGLPYPGLLSLKKSNL
ncbi:hypothetical protein BGW38_010482 [Lunasporangiospora selenospora]|uniref:DSBA-like thioredoxin domain-containing protein n=1 Tax=Lunasporangiospora selenospora TaxID=979761 RepID=A0A9P6KFH4_9FUNG|nr:hypothetical protein BGW38_010482 [Lunasporangiospora selenospora]